MTQNTPLDDVDKRLLALLQQDADRSLAELGDLVHLSPSAVQRRIARLRASGAIARQVAVLGDEVLPNVVRACVLVQLERESARLHAGFRDRVRAAAEVQQCYEMAGAWDYLVMMVAPSIPACRVATDRLFLDAPNVKRFETLFVLDAIKQGFTLPIAPPPKRASR